MRAAIDARGAPVVIPVAAQIIGALEYVDGKAERREVACGREPGAACADNRDAIAVAARRDRCHTSFPCGARVPASRPAL